MQRVEEEHPLLLNDIWAQNSEPFKVWLKAKDISETTKRDYYNSLIRFFDHTSVQKPQDFRALKLKDKEERGLRNLLNYFEEEEASDVAGHSIEKWRRYIKIKKSGVVEVYVTDDEIKEAYNACPEDIKPIHKLLVYSGNRLSHIHEMISTFDERNIVIDDDVAHYPTSAFSSGTKRTFQIFFPASFIPEFKNISNLRSYCSLLNR
ncbi:integrase [Methanomethylovorans sp.]|uniref:integrase n=1 Tax=Methanomethylovorans sp. TaxID=2758717 RepID=UPI00351C445F